MCYMADLIHNPQVIADLEQQGIRSSEDLDELTEGDVIIRSHGVSPEIYKKIEEKNIKIVDATCPIVKRIQRLVEALAKEEEEIVIVGNKNHPESRGLIGYSQGKGIIIESEAQAQKMLKKKRIFWQSMIFSQSVDMGAGHIVQLKIILLKLKPYHENFTKQSKILWTRSAAIYKNDIYSLSLK